MAELAQQTHPRLRIQRHRRRAAGVTNDLEIHLPPVGQFNRFQANVDHAALEDGLAFQDSLFMHGTTSVLDVRPPGRPLN
jgi:hypothetical protein